MTNINHQLHEWWQTLRARLSEWVCVSRLVCLTMCNKVWQVRSKKRSKQYACYPIWKKLPPVKWKLKGQQRCMEYVALVAMFCKPQATSNTDTNSRTHKHKHQHHADMQHACISYYFRSSHLPLTTRLANTHGSGHRRSVHPLLLHSKTICVCVCVAYRVEKLLRHKMKNALLFPLKKFHCSNKQIHTHRGR